MKIQKINTGIIITKTAKQPSAKIEFSLDELDALSEFCERLQDEKDIREYLNTAVTIPDSAEVSAPVAAKYLRDAALFEQLVDETRRNQEENQSNFLTAVSDAVSSIEKSRDVKEWHGLTKETAERFAREFMAERNPGRWSGFGEVPESVSLDPLNFPINDIYTPVRHGPKGGVTTAYHRDRGEDLEIDSIVVDTPVVLKTAETLFLNILKEENITYGYLYNVADKLWYAADTVQDNSFFVLDENFINAHT